MASNETEQMGSTQNDKDAIASSSKCETSPPNKNDSFEIKSRPICLIVLGMAGSGKTSFVKRLTQLGDLQTMKPYVINLDPAVQEVPYHTNIGNYYSVHYFVSVHCS